MNRLYAVWHWFIFCYLSNNVLTLYVLAVAVCRREIFSVKEKIGNMQKSYKKSKSYCYLLNAD